MITRLLVIANVLAFVWEVFATGGRMLSLMGSYSVDVHALGALAPDDVLIHHQWWRIVTSAFLHDGLLHIGVNMFSLWVLGRFIEAVAGPVRMGVIYGVSLVASGLGVVYLSPAYPGISTLGASGAIFGLFGALFAIGFKLGPPGMQLIRANIGILVLNLIFTFVVPGISWQAHVSGLVAGFLLTLAIYTPPKRVAPVVVDANTGDRYETEYQTPEPPH
ncbi:MAG TPA: rhomboid family intramembrane serine protease [Verrucomicrobiae bacterium]|nr:rhomboid family intramembrane serine protease [Verrucomicrobiae bacterium]